MKRFFSQATVAAAALLIAFGFSGLADKRSGASKIAKGAAAADSLLCSAEARHTSSVTGEAASESPALFVSCGGFLP